ncbi:MAG: 30S ribosomal protein S1 [Candidatus Marinimicrobia bacterium]|nr:30S ribosomal protein S1 [Candidatus Neomarinimicrobiota bacterium]
MQDKAQVAAGQDELASLYEKTLKKFAEQMITDGRVIEKSDNQVLVDVGYKSEGLLGASEFDDFESVQVGDQFEVLIVNLENDEGMIELSKRQAEEQRNWDRVLDSFTEGGTIQGVIKAKVKGGVIVDVGVEAFLPGSQLDLTPVRNLDAYLDQTYDFKVLKINRERRNIVLSRRELLEDLRREQRRVLLTEIKPGQMRHGTVKNITDFGAFVDLSGMDGLLHITDMSWGRITHPSEVVHVGQELDVIVLDVNLEKERISLGLKQKLSNPWDDIERRYPVGTRVQGKVVSLMPYGAFVEIEDGIEGLVHVSELSWTKRVAKAADVLQEGQEVEAVVLNINREGKKLSLGIRQTETNPWDLVQETYPIGARVKGRVRNFTTYGAFVELEEGVDGMIHVSDMSWTKKINHPSDALEKGLELECVVLEVDAANQRISLGLKQAQEDPWTGIANRFKIGQKVTGAVTKLAAFGAFVGLEEGVEGLVHISQISDDRVEHVRDVLKVGQEVEARVVKVDPVERRIGLSIKAAELSDDEFQVSDDMLTGLQPGTDLVDLAGAFDQAFGGQPEWHPGERKAAEAKEEAPVAEEPAEEQAAEEPAEDAETEPKQAD